MDDLEIIKKCLDGDLTFFGKLYEKYVDKIYSFVFFKTDDREVSEDIVSDVFMNALNKVSSFRIDENSSVSAWFYKIAHNKVIDYYRTVKQYEDIDTCLELGVDLDVGIGIDNKDKLKEIFKYINGLKREHREIFLYRIWSDLSYKEIADITGIETNNCRQIVSRILKNIEANFK